MDKIKIDNETWYSIEGIMALLEVKSNKTVYNKLDTGELKSRKILGKRVFALV